MATFSITNVFVANTKAKSAEVNQNFTDVLAILAAHHHDPNIYTGASPITNSGIAANAQILATQFQLPITRSGLMSEASFRSAITPGWLADSALPSQLNTKRFSKVEIGSAVSYIDVSSSEIQFTDPTNGTKRLSQFSVAKFGGDGSDGALSITSGTTTVDCAGARVVIKQYTSISITSTGKLAFSNPHANGSYIFILSQGGVTLTATAPCISVSAIGASATTGGTQGDFVGYATNAGSDSPGTGSPSTGGAVGTFTTNVTSLENFYLRRYQFLTPGAGGGAGSAQGAGSSAGAGGRGGGCLVIECNGAWNFTVSAGISVAGQAGFSSGSHTANQINGAGGGGGGGICYVLYNTLTSNSGTIDVAGGVGGTTSRGSGFGGTTYAGGGGGGSIIAAGGAGSSAAVESDYAAGSGGAGYSFVAKNLMFT